MSLSEGAQTVHHLALAGRVERAVADSLSDDGKHACPIRLTKRCRR
jgi:hypothetical protein